MTNPWDKNQGYEGFPESNDAYERFRAYLKLGSRRTIPELAKRLGITRQALGQVSRRYNWVERAAAYDQRYPPIIEGEPKPKIKEEDYSALPPPPPPPSSLPKLVIDTEIVLKPEAAEADKDKVNEVIQYRDSFRVIGKEMLDDANHMRQLAKIAHVDLTILWKRRIEALQNNEYALATLLCAQIRDITPNYWRLRESVRTYRQDASTHWGNATGISELLKKVYG
jgi:hypothetical protein